MSFLGFTVNEYGDLMDKENKKLITRGIMTNQLYQGLRLNGVDLFTQHESWNRLLFSIFTTYAYKIYPSEQDVTRTPQPFLIVYLL